MPAGTHFLNDASLPCLLRFFSSQKNATCDHNRWENAAASTSSHMQSENYESTDQNSLYGREF